MRPRDSTVQRSGAPPRVMQSRPQWAPQFKIIKCTSLRTSSHPPSEIMRKTSSQKSPPASNQDTGQSDTTEERSESGVGDGYPEQKHAGRVGYGPEYNKGPVSFPVDTSRASTDHCQDLGERVRGLKEVVKGEVTRNPDLVEQGHERETGELKQKERDKSLRVRCRLFLLEPPRSLLTSCPGSGSLCKRGG
jgi:hypothetical protein